MWSFNKIKVQSLVVLLLLGGLLLSTAPVYAQVISDPDTVQVNLATGYTSVIETGDVLIIVEYLIEYDTPPTTPSSQAFLLRLFNAGLEVGAANPFVRNPAALNLGYELSAVGFYFNPEDTALNGLLVGETLAPTITFRISGSPTYPGITTNYPVGVSQASGVPVSTRGRILRDLQQISRNLETDWGVRVLEGTGSGFQLSGTGQDYFVTVIPNIAAILPEVFPLSVSTPIFTSEDFDQTYIGEREAFVQSTPFYALGSAVEGWIGTPIDLNTSVIWFGLMWVSIVFFITNTKQQDFAIPVAIFLLMVGSYIGMVPGVLGIGLVALLTIGPTIGITLLRRHGG